MKISIATGCLLMVTYATALSVVPQEWHSFKALFGKTYSNPQEEEFRMKVYLENKKKIEEHNRAYENGKVTYTMKMNHFGDLLSHEFKAIMKGLKKSAVRNGEQYVPSNGKLPDSVDWRDKGAVTPVKNQGSCGASWAFSTTGALEGQMFLKKGKSVSLSAQNLIDCTRSYGNIGCEIGLTDFSFNYIRDNHGIDTEESYPYDGEELKCRFNKDTVGGTDTGFTSIAKGDEKALKDAVANVGPIAVYIDADHDSFHLYAEGIYNEPRCDDSVSNLAVLVVGYGTENGQDYWLVKNSWGSGWGDHGYMKMTRNKNNQCGIATFATYPNV